MNLEEFGYPVFYNSFRGDKCPVVVGMGSLQKIGDALQGIAETPKLALIADISVADLYGSQVLSNLTNSGFDISDFYLPIENKEKTLKTVERFYRFFKSIRADWGTTVLLMGGQVLIDSAAYAAISYCRGLHYALIPTTLLSQVDGAIGGATGVHYKHLTNYVGARRQPLLVWNDVQLLQSLPLRELKCGMVEIIKQSAVADKEMFQDLEKLSHFDLMDVEFLEWLVLRTVKVKSGIVDRSGDICLNFGHTIGHALESTLQHVGIKHGEGVSIGMIGEARAAEHLQVSATDNLKRLETLLLKFGLPVRIPDYLVDRFPSKMLFANQIWKNILYDKKMFGQELKWVVSDQIGSYIRLPVEKKITISILLDIMSS